MPVHFETTSATSSSVTLLRSSLWLPSALALERLLEPPLELGNLAVLELRHAAEIGRAARLLELGLRALELLLDVRLALHGGLLGLPDLLEVRELALELAICSSRSASRRFDASSDSFFNASRSILS